MVLMHVSRTSSEIHPDSNLWFWSAALDTLVVQSLETIPGVVPLPGLSDLLLDQTKDSHRTHDHEECVANIVRTIFSGNMVDPAIYTLQIVTHHRTR